MKIHTRATAALAMTCGLGLFAAAVPAVAGNEILGIGNGTLLARGIAFELSYGYTCDPGSTATSVVEVAQRVSKSQLAVAIGGSSNPTECTGNQQNITVVGYIKSSSLPLKNGAALARLNVNVSSTAQSLTFAKEIRLTSITRK